jgi:hypothetical protein
MPTQEARLMADPKPSTAPDLEPSPVPEDLVQPTPIQTTDRLREAMDRAPSAPLMKLNHHEHGRIRAACSAARRNYPEPVAKVLVNELMAFDEFGYRWARPGTVSPLIEHLLRPASVPSDAA